MYGSLRTYGGAYAKENIYPYPYARYARKNRRMRAGVLAFVAVLSLSLGVLLGRECAAAGVFTETAPERQNERPALEIPATVGMPDDPAAFGTDAALLDVPFLSQLPDYPNGCESVSAAMLLAFYGEPMDLDFFIDGFLPRAPAPQSDGNGGYVGGDPWEAFLGDPRREDGWGCYSPVMENALNAYFGAEGLSYCAESLQGETLSVLAETYIDAGTPVAIWATIDMALPRTGMRWTVPESGETRTWIAPMHCLVLTGYDADAYICNDPLSGANIRYDREAVENAYGALGSQALVILPA